MAGINGKSLLNANANCPKKTPIPTREPNKIAALNATPSEAKKIGETTLCSAVVETTKQIFAAIK
jgi:hypothetical protein